MKYMIMTFGDASAWDTLGLGGTEAVAQLDGPAAALTVLETVASDPRLTAQHRLFAVRAHLLEQLGDSNAAATEFRKAAHRTTSLPEQRYLLTRAAMLTAGRADPD